MHIEKLDNNKITKSQLTEEYQKENNKIKKNKNCQINQNVDEHSNTTTNL